MTHISFNFKNLLDLRDTLLSAYCDAIQEKDRLGLRFSMLENYTIVILNSIKPTF